MLQTYALHPDFFSPNRLQARDLMNFAALLDAMQQNVQLAVPRAEFPKFVALASAGNLGSRSAAIVERLLLHAANSDPVLQQIDSSSRTALGRCLDAATQARADAILVVGDPRPIPRSPCPAQALDTVVAGLGRKFEPVDLSACATLADLQALLAPLFRGDDYLLVIEPYIGSKVLRMGGQRQDKFLPGLRLILQIWENTRPRKVVPTVELLFDKCKTRGRDGEMAEGNDYVSIADRLRRELESACSAKIEILMSTRSFSDRGLRSSRRHWIIEHEVAELGKWLDRLEKENRSLSQAEGHVRLLFGPATRKLQDIRSNAQRPLVRS
jgi:hypothetical protein